MRQHPVRPPNPQITPASPAKAPASCTKPSGLATPAGTYVENLPWLNALNATAGRTPSITWPPPCWQTAGCGVDFAFGNYERMAAFMHRCKGKVMVSINDHPDIQRIFECFHFETTETRYTNMSQRHGKPEVMGELIIMNWKQEALEGLFQSVEIEPRAVCREDCYRPRAVSQYVYKSRTIL